MCVRAGVCVCVRACKCGVYINIYTEIHVDCLVHREGEGTRERERERERLVGNDFSAQPLLNFVKSGVLLIKYTSRGRERERAHQERESA